MNWISRVEEWLEKGFARVFAAGTVEGNTSEPDVDHDESKGRDSSEDLVSGPSLQPENGGGDTNEFALPFRKESYEPAGTEQTLRWHSPTGYELIVVKGVGIGNKYLGQQGTCLIGRAEDCDFSLSDVTISKHHARISSEGKSWFLEDLGSTNGTYVNGNPVARCRLGNNDKLKLGKTELEFRVLGNEGK